MSDAPTTLYPDAVGCEPIRTYSGVLADVAATTDIGLPVPSCDGWTLGDLVWHLAEVQYFWTHVIATRPSSPANHEGPKRPSDARLVANLRNATVGLVGELATASPEEPAWSWADDQRVAFTLRRQTHEALVHCIDGVLAAGAELPEVPASLAADGVDEVVHVMLDASGESGVVELHATDSGDRWHLDLPGEPATISGRALDLDLWLWGRTNTWSLSVTGDAAQVDAVRAAVVERTQ